MSSQQLNSEIKALRSQLKTVLESVSSIQEQQKNPELSSNNRAEFDLRIKPDSLPVVLHKEADSRFLLISRELAVHRGRTVPMFGYDLDSILQPDSPEESGKKG